MVLEQEMDKIKQKLGKKMKLKCMKYINGVNCIPAHVYQKWVTENYNSILFGLVWF